MDKKTILKVFGEAFLRSMVVLMAIVILGFSVFFIIKVRSDKKELAQKKTTEAGSTYSDEELQAMLDSENANDTKDDAATTEEVTTEEATTEQIPSNDKKIVVLNSTSTTGLAGKWQTKLVGAGFSNVGAGNYSAGAESQTKIYVKEEGMGEDLAAYFADATVEVGTPNTSSCSVTKGNITLNDADIIIVIGNSDTSVQ
mgnify:CR=1 FL=1